MILLEDCNINAKIKIFKALIWNHLKMLEFQIKR